MARAIVAATALVLWAGDVKESMKSKPDTQSKEKKDPKKAKVASETESLERRSTSDKARWNSWSNI